MSKDFIKVNGVVFRKVQDAGDEKLVEAGESFLSSISATVKEREREYKNSKDNYIKGMALISLSGSLTRYAKEINKIGSKLR